MEEENVVPMDKQEKVPSDKEADAMVQKWGHKCLDLIQEMADANVPHGWIARHQAGCRQTVRTAGLDHQQGE